MEENEEMSSSEINSLSNIEKNMNPSSASREGDLMHEAIVDKAFSESFGTARTIFEMDIVLSPKEVAETSPKKLTIMDITRAVRSLFFHNMELSGEQYHALHERVQLLPSGLEEKEEFMDFYKRVFVVGEEMIEMTEDRRDEN